MIEGGKRELRRKQPWRRNTGAAPTTLPENAAVEVACEIAREEETVAREGDKGGGETRVLCVCRATAAAVPMVVRWWFEGGRKRERERVAVEPPESNSGRRWWCMAGERGGGR